MHELVRKQAIIAMEDDGMLLNLAGLDDTAAHHEIVRQQSSNTSKWSRRNQKKTAGVVSFVLPWTVVF